MMSIYCSKEELEPSKMANDGIILWLLFFSQNFYTLVDTTLPSMGTDINEWYTSSSLIHLMWWGKSVETGFWWCQRRRYMVWVSVHWLYKVLRPPHNTAHMIRPSERLKNILIITKIYFVIEVSIIPKYETEQRNASWIVSGIVLISKLFNLCIIYYIFYFINVFIMQ